MLEFRTLDVFTTQPFTGNPLAVVLGADGLSTAQMQTIAREFNLSETIFVMAPREAAHRARVRIFFPTAEIPFAGHPTIGCAILLATMDAAPGDFEAHLVLEEEAGLVPVTVWRKGRVTEAEFTAPVIPHGTEGLVHAALADALGLTPEEIGFGAHRPGVWQGGPRFLYVPVASLSVLARARAMQPHWDAVMAAAGVDSAYLYTPGRIAISGRGCFRPRQGYRRTPPRGRRRRSLPRN
jgi:trans-2,3-dihydro-3-hydroxyanthranilate isomerase